MMKYLGKYKEFSPQKKYPSIKDSCLKEPYEGQEIIAEYLTHGTKDLYRDTKALDVFTGEVIGSCQIGMNDGEYTWYTFLAYYVKKYNLRLPKEFENKVLGL